MSLEEGGTVSARFEVFRRDRLLLMICSSARLLQVVTSCEFPERLVSRARFYFVETRPDVADSLAPLLLFPISLSFDALRFTGMAIRVVQDLGMQHEISLAPRGEGGPNNESQREEIARRRLLFWSVFLMDRFISWGVG